MVRIGLVGFPGSGKTTLFNALTGLDAPVGFGGDLRVGAVKVPDPRLDWISAAVQPRKTTHAEVVFCDVPGEYAAGRRSLSDKALRQIREQDALCLVLRDFDNPALDEAPDPLGEMYAFVSECVLADLDVVERRLQRMSKEKSDLREQKQLEEIKGKLEEEVPLRLLGSEVVHRNLLRGYAFLTDKPLLAVLNQSEEKSGGDPPVEFAREIERGGARVLALCASIESEISRLDPDDQADFLEDMGMSEPVLHRFIRASHNLLDVISFFTVSKEEVRAWTIRRGTSARQAAGRVHSDMERGFIRAEIVPFEVFEKHGSWSAVKAANEMRVEGAGYVLQDGDIMQVRFNV